MLLNYFGTDEVARTEPSKFSLPHIVRVGSEKERHPLNFKSYCRR
jgi:hypothetical protein